VLHTSDTLFPLGCLLKGMNLIWEHWSNKTWGLVVWNCYLFLFW